MLALTRPPNLLRVAAECVIVGCAIAAIYNFLWTIAVGIHEGPTHDPTGFAVSILTAAGVLITALWALGIDWRGARRRIGALAGAHFELAVLLLAILALGLMLILQLAVNGYRVAVGTESIVGAYALVLGSVAAAAVAMRAREWSGGIAAALSAGAPEARIAVRSHGRIDYVPVDAIISVRGAQNYVELRLADRVVLHRATMRQIEANLPAGRFLKVHRSAIVNLARVKGLERKDGGTQLVMSDGERVAVGPAQRRLVSARLSPEALAGS